MVRGLTLVILLLNVLAGAVLPPGAMMVPTGEQMEICTAAGMVVIDENGIPAMPGNRAGHAGGLCVFCSPLLHAGGDAPPVVVAVERLAWPDPIAFPAEPDHAPPLRRRPGASGPRAPPIA